MPARGDHVAPTFDPKQPRELRRYFEDLEFLFNRARVTNATEKKVHACRYVDFDTSELWASLADYATVARYEDFREAIYELYPGSEEERRWSVADMDELTGERLRLGIQNLADLGDYHRQFLAITTFLRSKNRISENEQCRAFAPVSNDSHARRCAIFSLRHNSDIPNSCDLISSFHYTACDDS